ncbi:hypothetical protein [Yinghuangia soli]|jgi:hypothetical protein|uniref:Uncharacterized protein n=1 Tax=Yinghuangia soli TaxID=2908204 RepID=A0AA41Q6R9_9ACTN|nr:hypothetical protein [Yinghuangia soli]MCF2532623.1 hypothetical protein [Yinghuangia soli]
MPPEPSKPRIRPARLLFEPSVFEREEERFFDLDDLTDPQVMLDRSTQLAEAFRAAADKAVDYQAIAVARLADRRRFDRLEPAQIAARTGWSEAYTVKMIEYGERLIAKRGD